MAHDKPFGTALREARRKKQLTREQVAFHSQLSLSTIVRCESESTVDPPSLRTFVRLLKVFPALKPFASRVRTTSEAA